MTKKHSRPLPSTKPGSEGEPGAGVASILAYLGSAKKRSRERGRQRVEPTEHERVLTAALAEFQKLDSGELERACVSSATWEVRDITRTVSDSGFDAWKTEFAAQLARHSSPCSPRESLEALHAAMGGPQGQVSKTHGYRCMVESGWIPGLPFYYVYCGSERRMMVVGWPEAKVAILCHQWISNHKRFSPLQVLPVKEVTEDLVRLIRERSTPRSPGAAADSTARPSTKGSKGRKPRT